MSSFEDFVNAVRLFSTCVCLCVTLAALFYFNKWKRIDQRDIIEREIENRKEELTRKLVKVPRFFGLVMRDTTLYDLLKEKLQESWEEHDVSKRRTLVGNLWSSLYGKQGLFGEKHVDVQPNRPIWKPANVQSIRPDQKHFNATLRPSRKPVDAQPIRPERTNFTATKEGSNENWDWKAVLGAVAGVVTIAGAVARDLRREAELQREKNHAELGREHLRHRNFDREYRSPGKSLYESIAELDVSEEEKQKLHKRREDRNKFMH